MAETQKAAGANAALVESLVKKHFGPECTSRLAWSITRGRYRPSDQPKRLAAPQRDSALVEDDRRVLRQPRLSVGAVAGGVSTSG
jgi:transcriptional regulator GlxA family with amidase domain